MYIDYTIHPSSEPGIAPTVSFSIYSRQLLPRISIGDAYTIPINDFFEFITGTGQLVDFMIDCHRFGIDIKAWVNE
jgi:hypothetical protein